MFMFLCLYLEKGYIYHMRIQRLDQMGNGKCGSLFEHPLRRSAYAKAHVSCLYCFSKKY